uniref:Uncharacterized protein n=1 Tax=Romanomermis culicivorax TaxID=13658 RepID=A0A915JEB3_ROMCU
MKNTSFATILQKNNNLVSTQKNPGYAPELTEPRKWFGNCDYSGASKMEARKEKMTKFEQPVKILQ